VTVLVFPVSPVSAIQFGTPDGDAHPYVCLIVFDDADGPAWRTTGIVLSPTVVLTAGHGTYGAVRGRVWLASDMQGNTEYPYGGDTSYEAASLHYHPNYQAVPGPGLPKFDSRDVGIVILAEPIPTSELAQYGDLPAAGQVDNLSMMTSVDLVGYGVQWQKKGIDEEIGLPPGFYPPPPYYNWKWNGQRYYALANLVQSEDIISEEFLKVTANPGKGKGGTTFGDSGGPILLAGSNTILGINSFVNNFNCDGVTYAQRIDLSDILLWIDGFLHPSP